MSKNILFPFVLLIVVACLLLYLINPKNDNSLLVYCSHDSVYSSDIFKDFEQKTGIKIVPRFDTEATKSLGLVEMLKAEKDNPQCDVFWNNELLGMMELQKQGILEPYRGKGYGRIPGKFKDPEGYWTGFAARLRVVIFNTGKVRPDQAEVTNRFSTGDLSRVCIAKPLYGTTFTHYCAMWSEYGEDKLKELQDNWTSRGLIIVNGNAASKDAVAGGSCDFGWTDTDDYFDAKKNNGHVAVLPARLESGKTICIPNTVAVIKGTKKKENAQKLVDYLLSEECEIKLANSKARQIPLGPVDETKLPEEMKDLKKWAAESINVSDLSDVYPKCLAWLKGKY